MDELVDRFKDGWMGGWINSGCVSAWSWQTGRARDAETNENSTAKTFGFWPEAI